MNVVNISRNIVDTSSTYEAVLVALEGVVADDGEDDEEVTDDDHDDEDEADEEEHRPLNVAVGEVGVEEGELCHCRCCCCCRC